jgi:excinuclease ABC subunit C
VRPAVVAALPSAPGVYRFLDERERVIYVGRATDLRRRVGSYWGDLGDRRHLRRMVPQVAHVQAVECASVHEAAWLERNLLERARPRWNRVRGGLEVPTYLRLTVRAEEVELTVLHAAQPATGDEVFGPYLGGGRSRLAVSGLDRALSLSYAGARRGGFDRDMARLRGVVDGDLASRAGRAVGALKGEPTALSGVREALVEHRTVAARSLAFELAARIDEELDALAWVTSEQRVRVDGAGDADVHGWAGGVLVGFEVRAGRLSRWRQRSETASRARQLVELTPRQWQGFAGAAAELAARLTGVERAAT